MTNKGIMTIQIENDLKEQATELFNELGLDVNTAVCIFLKQSLQCNGLPFEVKANEPNDETYKAMHEAEQLLKDPHTKHYTSVDELFEELEKE